jgi:hypothetical protein
MAAQTSHAPLALNWAEGRWAIAESFKSAMTCSTIVWSCGCRVVAWMVSTASGPTELHSA